MYIYKKLLYTNLETFSEYHMGIEHQGRQSRGGWGVATPPEFWKGGLNPP